MDSGIYKIVNTVNGKLYIGSTVDLYKRWIRGHRCHLRRNIHRNRYLQRAWNKYEEKSFTFVVMEKISNKKLLIQREQHWMDLHKSYERLRGYNLSPTAQSNLGIKFSEETRQKLSEAHRGKNNPMFGRKHNEETKEKIRSTKLGKNATKETRKKMSLSHKGIRFSELHKIRIGLANKQRVYKKASKDTKRKMSIAHIGRKHSEETKKKMSAAQLKRYSRQEEERAA